MTQTNAWPPPYKIRKHRLAKYVKLRATERNGLEITVPYRLSLKEIPAILEKHKAWIIKQIALIRPIAANYLPDFLLLHAMNVTWRVVYEESIAKLKLMQRPDHELVLIGNIQEEALCKKHLIAWIKKQARLFLFDELAAISAETGLHFVSASLRDQQTVWGSCTVNKTISLNYKLIFLPPQLVRYVLIHELCHTKHLNHSAKFWHLVSRYDPQCLEHRRQLRNANQYIPRWLVQN